MTAITLTNDEIEFIVERLELITAGPDAHTAFLLCRKLLAARFEPKSASESAKEAG